jgi:hypothetical protein
MNQNIDGARIHREELDQQIEMLRAEREVAGRATPGTDDGRVARARLVAGRALIAAGTALAGSRTGVGRPA